MTARVASIEPPYAPELQAIFDRMMPPGIPPLTLFTTLASDRRLFDQRRRAIDNDFALMQGKMSFVKEATFAEAFAFFADRAGLNEAQRHSLVQGNGNDSCWSHE